MFFVVFRSWRPPAGSRCLPAEAVEGLALALERVHDVHGRDGLAAGVLGVGHRVTDDVLEEDLEDTAGLLVDEARDALDATTAGKAADGRLGDACGRGRQGGEETVRKVKVDIYSRVPVESERVVVNATRRASAKAWCVRGSP